MAKLNPIDARRFYQPEIIPSLIEKAKPLVGTYKTLARRLDLTEGHLRKIRNKTATGGYGEQVMLEVLIDQEGGERE